MAYNTEQRRILHRFFEEHPHEKFCVKDICSALSGADISVSAIYRNLADMKKEGLVRCHTSQDSRDIFYQFVDSEHCADSIHLTCTDCGKTFHMDKTVARHVQSELAELEGFQINKSRTVLYGTCKNCKK